MTNLRPPGAIRGSENGQPTAQLPNIAPAPRRTLTSAAQSDESGDLRWVLLAAAGSGALGLVGGGHIGLLAARARKRRV
jgi:hypothetical protein